MVTDPVTVPIYIQDNFYPKSKYSQTPRFFTASKFEISFQFFELISDREYNLNQLIEHE